MASSVFLSGFVGLQRSMVRILLPPLRYLKACSARGAQLRLCTLVKALAALAIGQLVAASGSF
eukprot:13186892-Alexandrium_andersonii.AAC.1